MDQNNAGVGSPRCHVLAVQLMKIADIPAIERSSLQSCVFQVLVVTVSKHAGICGALHIQPTSHEGMNKLPAH
jgi:hypothetical protein